VLSIYIDLSIIKVNCVTPKTVNECFSWDCIADQFIQEYKKALFKRDLPEEDDSQPLHVLSLEGTVVISYPLNKDWKPDFNLNSAQIENIFRLHAYIIL